MLQIFDALAKKNEPMPQALRLSQYVDFKCTTFTDVQTHMESVGVFYEAETEDSKVLLIFQYHKLRLGKISRCADKITVHHLRGIIIDFAKQRIHAAKKINGVTSL